MFLLHLVAYSLVAIIGATADLGLMWSVAETFNGLMAIPNLIGLIGLRKEIVEETEQYFECDQEIEFITNIEG